MKKQQICLRISMLLLSGLLCVSQWISVFALSAAETENNKTNISDVKSEISDSVMNYRNAKNIYDTKKYPSATDVVTVKAENMTSEGKPCVTETGIGGHTKSAFVWKKEAASVSFTISIPQNALYQVEVDYYMLDGFSSKAQRRLLVDGVLPYSECNELSFTRWWKDAGLPSTNNIGDQVRPSQEEIKEWHTVRLSDNLGQETEPFFLYLEAGEHTITMEYILQDMALSEIRFCPPLTYPTYAEYAAENRKHPKGTDKILFEAESFDYIAEKNAASIAQIASGDPCNRPYDMKNKVFNGIGGSSWSSAGETITWSFQVERAGLYKLAFWSLQNTNDGLPVYRQISIDDTIPFQEMLSYRFDYDDNWCVRTLSDNKGNPYLFYLSAGKHTLSMTVNMGDLGSISQDVFQLASDCSAILQKIVKITGSSPDVNFEYELIEKIPDLTQNINHIVDTLQDCMNRLQALSTIKKPTMVSTLKMVSSTFEKMLEKPENIPRMLDDIRTSQSQLGDWYAAIQKLPMTLDYIWIVPEETETVGAKSSFWKKLAGTFYNFFVSFTRDYNNIGGLGTDSAETLDVWISRGSEWGQTLKGIADTQFTPKFGITVNVRMLPASQLEAGAVNALMLAVNSGNVPDVALGLASNSPVEYAIRGALTDLSDYPDYKEITERFHQECSVPYAYHGGVYALPETMDFRALFYRTDIFEEYGFSVPNSWEEVYKNLLPALYRNNLQFYIPPDYTTFLLQHGGSYYTEDLMASALDTPEAYKAFKEYTEMFTSYGMPISSNFYMRMRTGEMPIGIGSYAEYLMLKTAAPELMGRWSMAPVPGLLKADGTIDRTVGGIASTACVIMSDSSKQKNAWEFLKWYTSVDTQLEYGRELEALIGSSARWNTANTEAFSNLPWNQEELNVIEYMWDWVKETPVVLGGYMTGRNVYNAWNSVVVGGENPRSALEKAVKTINREMQMKQLEYEVKPLK